MKKNSKKNINYAEKLQTYTIESIANLYASELTEEWNKIPWKKIKKHIQKIQVEIIKTIKNKNYRKTRQLENLLLKSNSLLLYSIKEVVYKKDVDKAKCMATYHKLKNKTQQKTWLTKTGKNNSNTKILKNMIKITVQPRLTGEYLGCKKQDILMDICNIINNIGMEYIITTKIEINSKKEFQEYILKKLGNFPAKKIIINWLKKGYMDKINLTSWLIKENHDYKIINNTNKTIIFTKNAKKTVSVLKLMLNEIGLGLSDEEMEIKSIKKGFDYEEYHIYITCDTKVMVDVSQETFKEIKSELRKVYDTSKGHNVTGLILKWNMILKQKSLKLRSISTKKTLRKIDNYLRILTKKFLKRLHPNKSKKWIKKKYFHKGIFRDPSNPEIYLKKISWLC